MKMKSSLLRYALLSVVSLTLGGCVVANTIADPETRLRIQPSISINPDNSGRPSPLVIRVYELSSRNAFQSSDFFNLYDDAEQTLGSDLISVEDMVVRPGRVHEHAMSLSQQTRYIGVMAAFRDIQNAQWRLVAEADPRGYNKVNIIIDRLTLKRSEE
jgi:type VI secretion system protein VasD